MPHTLKISTSPTEPGNAVAIYDMLPDYEWGSPGTAQNRSVFLCEVTANMSLARPAYQVKDLTGRSLHLAVYAHDSMIRITGPGFGDRDPEEVAWANLPVGATICIKNACQHHFMDGQEGIRLDTGGENSPLGGGKALRCTMAQLAALNDRLRANDGRTCFNPTCLKANIPRDEVDSCSACRVPYCSKLCRENHQNKGHKGGCAIVTYLRELNE